jgi:restriction system protein
MTIPDYQTIMLPLLKLAEDRQEHSIREAIDHIANLFKLSAEEGRELLPSGQQTIIDNRVGWARTYLKKAGLLETPRRSFLRITDLGAAELAKNLTQIDIRYLEQFPMFVEFRKLRRESLDDNDHILQHVGDAPQTPQELMEDGYQKIRGTLTQEILDLVKQCSPQFFERLVVDLLLKMGYGGSIKDAGQVIGQSGDGGIDGIIKEDKLGLDVIYIQAKRWENSVGSKEIRNFVGSLVGQKANKGIFITSSWFTRDAMEYVGTIGHKVILIDGDLLAQLMIDNDVGVSKVNSYDVKRVDTDYFVEV